MIYLTYDEYVEIGGTLDLTAFNRHIMRACGIVDAETFRRVEPMIYIPVEVKYLCRDLTEYLANVVLREKNVTSRSQSAGAVSESESYAQKSQSDIWADIDNMVYDYLATVMDDKGTPLLYRGNNAGEVDAYILKLKTETKKLLELENNYIQGGGAGD